VAATTANIQYLLPDSNVEGFKGCLAPTNAFLGLRHPALDSANLTAEFHYSLRFNFASPLWWYKRR
jgi:hypothetical protein